MSCIQYPRCGNKSRSEVQAVHLKLTELMNWVFTSRVHLKKIQFVNSQHSHILCTSAEITFKNDSGDVRERRYFENTVVNTFDHVDANRWSNIARAPGNYLVLSAMRLEGQRL